MPYSPSRYAVQGSIRFSSSMTACTIWAVAAPGAYQAEVPSSSTTSPPPFAVRWTSSSMRSRPTSFARGTPPTVVAETTETIWSPCPPRTSAWTSFPDAPVSQAMNVRKRAVSRMPACPKTRCFGKPETFFATWHIASSGFETTIRIASGDAATTCSVTDLTIFSFVETRSSRLIPGERGLPAVITTTSEPAVSSYPFVPTIVGSNPSTEPAWFMSRALPCGRFSLMSTSTTSA